jgi:hypothetical protein
MTSITLFLFAMTAITVAAVRGLVGMVALLALLVAVVMVMVVAVLIVGDSSVSLELSPLLKTFKRQFLCVQWLGDRPFPQTRGLLFVGFGFCQALELKVSLVEEEQIK